MNRNLLEQIYEIIQPKSWRRGAAIFLAFFVLLYVRYRVWEVRIVLPAQDGPEKKIHIGINDPYPLRMLAEAIKRHPYAQRYVVAWDAGYKREARLVYLPGEYRFEVGSGCLGTCAIEPGPFRYVYRDDIFAVANRGEGAVEIKQH